MKVCVDCDRPSLEGLDRCPDCLEEIRETPLWRGAPRQRVARIGAVLAVLTAPAKTCSEPDCNHCVKAHGLCDRHYVRPNRRRICEVCDRPYVASYHKQRTCGQDCGAKIKPKRPPRPKPARPKCGQCGRLLAAGRLVDGRVFTPQWCRGRCTAVASGEVLIGPKPPPPVVPKPDCSREGCARPAKKRGMCQPHYNRANGYTGNAELERARLRQRSHERRERMKGTGDITHRFEMDLRAKAKRCPMPGCGVRLIDAPYQPASKELDHIVPLNVGGTHTIGNVRIICRTCNIRRPKDGSDYTGPVTLWAEVA